MIAIACGLVFQIDNAQIFGRCGMFRNSRKREGVAQLVTKLYGPVILLPWLVDWSVIFVITQAYGGVNIYLPNRKNIYRLISTR